MKVVKIPIDLFVSCPHKGGRKGYGICTFIILAVVKTSIDACNQTLPVFKSMVNKNGLHFESVFIPAIKQTAPAIKATIPILRIFRTSIKA